jgi:tripartite-type tricarboxylate transporter receptor subunit TctC
MVKAGKLRPLAVDTAQRLSDYPDVPTMAEAGFPPKTSVQWQALFAPAGTPEPVLEKIHAAVMEALATDGLKDVYAKLTTHINPTKSLPEAKAWLEREMKTWGAIVNDLQVQPEE